MSNLLLIIHEVNKVIYLQEEIVVYVICKWWGWMLCDLLSNLILTEKTPVYLGFNAVRLLMCAEFYFDVHEVSGGMFQKFAYLAVVESSALCKGGG